MSNFRHFGRQLVAAASVAGLSLLMLSCGASNTIDFLYVTSNLQNPGQINAYIVDSESGALKQIADSPYPSGGRNPVYEVAAPNGLNLYVANHDDNTIVQYAIGTDGKLYPLNTINTPGTEPVALAINAAGTYLYVLDYYAPAAPGQPSYTDLNPGPGALIVYPINSDGSLGTALPITNAPIGPTTTANVDYQLVQCFPTGIAVTPNQAATGQPPNYDVYVTNTNAVVVTTSPPVTGTVPILPASCPSSGTISGYSVTIGQLPSNQQPIAVLIPPSGNPVSTGSSSEPTGVIADPSGSSLYVTDAHLNQLYTYSIQSGSGALSLASAVASGTMPMGGTVVSSSSGKFLYITNYADGTLSIYSLGSGLPVPVTTGNPPETVIGNSGGSGPLCVLADPDTQRFLYTADYIGGTVGGDELNPSTGTLIINQGQPYVTSGQPTCVAAIAHVQGKKNGV